MHGETVGATFARWLAVHSLGRKPRSVEFNTEIFAVIVARWPGPLNGVTAAVSVASVIEFAQRVTHYCPARWNAFVAVLRFTVPCAAAHLQRRPLTAKERANLSKVDFGRLCAELDLVPRSHGGLVVRFLAQTAFRINEARQVEWKHVQADCIYLPAETTKNGRPRVVPFIAGTADVLERLRKVTGTGERVLPQAECQTALRSACVRLGLPRLSHHDFRHLFATRAIECGVDVPTVARWLGHRDGGALLARRYFHLLDEHSRRMAGRVVI